MENDVPREFTTIHGEGEKLQQDIDAHLERWPRTDGRTVSHHHVLPEDFMQERLALQDSASRWFNRIYVDVLPYTTFDRRYVNVLLRRVIAATAGGVYREEARRRDHDGVGYTLHDTESPIPIDHARGEAADAMSLALRVIRTAAPIKSKPQASPQNATATHVQNTAFILMWMDPARPELVDVHEAVKEIFAEFGVRAYRADEIQHQDRITDLVLEQIRSAEFLFADLTGERPNVYYEIGYAHAIGKRPILYRRSGTPLHFDLSVHNVPEYENVTSLRKLLRARLAAITGKDSMLRTGAEILGA